MMKFRQFNSGDSRAYSGLERGPGRLRRVRYLTRVTRGRHSPLGYTLYLRRGADSGNGKQGQFITWTE